MCDSVGSDDPEFAHIYALIDYESDGINDRIFDIFPQTAVDQIPSNVLIHDNTLFTDDRTGRTIRCPNVHQQVLSMTEGDESLIGCETWFSVPIGGGGHNKHKMAVNPITEEICICFGVDGNIINPVPPEGEVRCFNTSETITDWNDGEVILYGMRNSVGLEFHPLTNELWYESHSNLSESNQPTNE